MAKKNTLYQIKITLRHIRPPIWRRLLVPADCTMDALHCALQTAMGWTDAHLYAFQTKDRDIEIPDPDNMWDASWSRRPKPEDAGKVKLSELAEPGDTIIYDYDFGDGWEHTVVIEKAVEADDVAARKASAWEASAPARRRIAAAHGGISTCWQCSQSRKASAARTKKNLRTGSAASGMPRHSVSMASMARWPDGSPIRSVLGMQASVDKADIVMRRQVRGK